MRKGTEYLVGVCLCQIVISLLVRRWGGGGGLSGKEFLTYCYCLVFF